MFLPDCSIVTQKRVGLLPFKKRRFNLMTSTCAVNLEEPTRVLSSAETGEDFASPRQCTNTRSKNLEALASIAASYSQVSESYSSDSSNTSTSSKFSERSISSSDLETHNRESQCGNAMDDVTQFLPKVSSKSPAVPLCDSPFLSGKVGNLCVVTPTSSVKESLGRLDTPLPNGCHGRTSRNNSFCRRQPCYNGSNFCKLHYQHYLFCRARSVSMDETVISVSSAGSGVVPAESAVPQGQATPTHSDLQKTAMVQDKRYSEGKNECRCQATTTRGRSCAYVAVHETKYCYMHATYETSPPPRRGAGRGPLETASAIGVASTDVNTPSVVHEVKHDVISKKRGSSDDMPLPSLSTLSLISTDHWFGKRVIVGAGPLVHQCGSIQRWGNGWVTVELENGMGVHNRRSFELIIHPQQKKPDKGDELQTT